MSAIALATTTINVPHLLEQYARDARTHGRDVKFYVAGDRKTPMQAPEACAAVSSETGVECEYIDCAAQDAFLRSWPRLAAHLPWNCVQRRNVAILKAAVDGAQTIVTIDDDNFVEERDYFGAHEIVGQQTELEEFGRPGEWFNVCSFLTEASGRQFYARGYGMNARSASADSQPQPMVASRRIAVNAGLWLGDPDIDASTRLSAPVTAVAYDRQANFLVAPGSWTPFNSQNTALARAVLPAYFLSPFVGRFDDILASFIVKRIADHLNEGVAFGRPLVRQERNEHDLLNDLALENLGMKITDEFVQALQHAKLSGSSYAACAVELCDQAEAAMGAASLANAERARLAAFFAGYRMWVELPLW